MRTLVVYCGGIDSVIVSHKIAVAHPLIHDYWLEARPAYLAKKFA